MKRGRKAENDGEIQEGRERTMNKARKAENDEERQEGRK